MVTQKSNLYIELFSSLPRLRPVSCVLLQLNILCTSLVKLHYTENDDSPIIHRPHVISTLRVLQRIGFDRNGVMHISKRSALYQAQ